MDIKIKKLFVIILIFTVIVLYLIHLFVLNHNINTILKLNYEIMTQSNLYHNQLQDYINLESNKKLLFELNEERTRELVSFDNLPIALVNISNLMKDKNLLENKFNIGNRQDLSNLGNLDKYYNNIYMVPLNISGVGSYNDIIKYLDSLNFLDYFLLVDRVNITPTLQEELFYVDLHIFIIVGDKYEQ